jgi:hypothetical protein
MVAHVVGDIITGDIAEPKVIVISGPSVGGLLNSLTGSIGFSARLHERSLLPHWLLQHQLHQSLLLMVLFNRTP